MSIFRTPSPLRSAKFHLAVTTPVVVVAAVAGTVGVWTAGPAATARPAAASRPAGPGSHAGPAGARLLIARPAARPAQLDAFLAAPTASKPIVSGSVTPAKAKTAKAKLTPRQLAIRLLARFHWSRWQFPFLNKLWSRESSWNVHAENLYSGAYGIPQAVPGTKMSAAGPHWRTSARTQILWGLEYIKGRYGSPEAAWDHELATGWY